MARKPSGNLPDSSTETPGPPSPRAFAHATGYVYQSVGFLFTITMCCTWSSNCWQNQLPVTQPADVEQRAIFSAPAPELWAMAAVTASFVGGLLLIGLGFAMQQDRLRMAWLPMVLTGAVGLLFWAYLGFAVFSFPATGRIIVSALGALAWTVLFLLAGVSNEQLRLHPPTRSEQSWTSRDEDDFRKSLSPGSRDKTSR